MLKFALAIFISFTIIDRCTTLSQLFVLVGGTGDLARKYLWDALYRHVRSDQIGDKRVICASRTDRSSGQQELRDILYSIDPKANDHLGNGIDYEQLVSDIDYASFCSTYANDLTNVTFYLSVPPHSYEKILLNINIHCQSKFGQLTAVLEKPFARDADELENLRKITDQLFFRDRLFLIDHYLWKPTAESIADFRRRNTRWYKPDAITKLQLVLLESIGVPIGRTEFYRQYGVVRDVMQSHLTEIFLLLLNDLSSDSLVQSHLEILGQISLHYDSLITGKHVDYANVTAEFDLVAPTFAEISGRWLNANVVFVGGKYFDIGRSYAKIEFESGDSLVFCLSEPLIIIQKKSSDIICPKDWRCDESANADCLRWQSLLDIDCQKVSLCRRSLPSDQARNYAYRSIIDQLFGAESLDILEQRSVNLQYLTESWRLWNAVVQLSMAKKSVIYSDSDHRFFSKYRSSNRDFRDKAEL